MANEVLNLTMPRKSMVPDMSTLPTQIKDIPQHILEMYGLVVDSEDPTPESPSSSDDEDVLIIDERPNSSPAPTASVRVQVNIAPKQPPAVPLSNPLLSLQKLAPPFNLYVQPTVSSASLPPTPSPEIQAPTLGILSRKPPAPNRTLPSQPLPHPSMSLIVPSQQPTPNFILQYVPNAPLLTKQHTPSRSSPLNQQNTPNSTNDQPKAARPIPFNQQHTTKAHLPNKQPRLIAPLPNDQQKTPNAALPTTPAGMYLPPDVLLRKARPKTNEPLPEAAQLPWFANHYQQPPAMPNLTPIQSPSMSVTGNPRNPAPKSKIKVRTYYPESVRELIEKKRSAVQRDTTPLKCIPTIDIENGDAQYCELCKKTVTEIGLEAHMKKHCSQKGCLDLILDDIDKMRHQKMHDHPIKPFACRFCKKRYRQYRFVAMHYKMCKQTKKAKVIYDS